VTVFGGALAYGARAMADEPETNTDDQPRECQACRGTGKVISNLGGSPSTIDCPWCEGRGHFIPDHNAQTRWTESPSADA
jgi:DnaJ-class molecular chaperone